MVHWPIGTETCICPNKIQSYGRQVNVKINYYLEKRPIPALILFITPLMKMTCLRPVLLVIGFHLHIGHYHFRQTNFLQAPGKEEERAPGIRNRIPEEYFIFSHALPTSTEIVWNTLLWICQFIIISVLDNFC